MDKDDDLLNCSKEELIEKIRKLRLHVKQLRNVIQKSKDPEDEPSPKKRKQDRPFDFSKHPRRHVALKVAYLGWDYQGLASQEDSENTIEAHFFKALLRTKLIESRETCNYHRCGRTDKGVSAFEQVLSLDLRCRKGSGIGVITSTTLEVLDEVEEFDYPKILNKNLPPEIRVLDYAYVESNFSARYDCTNRTYYYFFPREDLNIKKMEEAAAFLVGTHDFRNFSKLDPTGKKPTIREIIEVKFRICKTDVIAQKEIFIFRIQGRSFIWHQIRCIIAILLLIGKSLEEPKLVLQLLNIELQPKKPQYSMAMDFPLVLFETKHGDLQWTNEEENRNSVLKNLHKEWLNYAIKTSMIAEMISRLEMLNPEIMKPNSYFDVIELLIMGSKSKQYKPILQRPVCTKFVQE